MKSLISTMSNQTILGIIPARGGSKGLPRKNILPLAGIPLISHTINAAAQSKYLTSIVVNTDDDEIAAVAEDHKVNVQRRPSEMGSDVAKVDELLIWSVMSLESELNLKVDIVVLLYPTAPLRPAAAIDDTIEQITEHNCDSALTLVEDTGYLWSTSAEGNAQPTNYDPSNRAPRQQEAWNQWRENKAVYAMRRELLINTRCRLGGKIGFAKMDPLSSIDIDNASDLEIANSIFQIKKRSEQL